MDVLRRPPHEGRYDGNKYPSKQSKPPSKNVFVQRPYPTFISACDVYTLNCEGFQQQSLVGTGCGRLPELYDLTTQILRLSASFIRSVYLIFTSILLDRTYAVLNFISSASRTVPAIALALSEMVLQ